jgi:tetratricopeptide (TPR) repeat protein
MCHRAAVKHYQEVLTADRYDPRYSFELIYHAVLCNMGEAALEEGSRLLPYLRGALLYEDAVSEGMYILSHVSEVGRTEKLSLFLNELGLIFYNVGDYKKTIEYYEKALKIGIEIYGETHPAVATRLKTHIG